MLSVKTSIEEWGCVSEVMDKSLFEWLAIAEDRVRAI